MDGQNIYSVQVGLRWYRYFVTFYSLPHCMYRLILSFLSSLVLWRFFPFDYNLKFSHSSVRVRGH